MIGFVILMLIVAIAIFAFSCIVSKEAKMEDEALQQRIKNGDYVNDYDRRQPAKTSALSKKLKIIAIIPVFIMVCTLLISGIRIVDATEIGVVKTFGEIHGTIDSGFHIINPLTSKVQMYDLRVHVRQSEFSSYTKDAQPVTATVEYQFELDPAYVMDVAKAYGSQDILESKIGNIVEEKVKVVFARYSAMTLLENRANLSTEIDSAVTPLEEMFHINFTSVIAKDIDFSDAFEKSVEAKMEAEQNALKAEQEKKKAVIKAEEAREVAAINAEAEIAKAKGEAEALMITKEALEKMPASWIQQMYLERWDGVLPQIVSEGSNLMITPKLG